MLSSFYLCFQYVSVYVFCYFWIYAQAHEKSNDLDVEQILDLRGDTLFIQSSSTKK